MGLFLIDLLPLRRRDQNAVSDIDALHLRGNGRRTVVKDQGLGEQPVVHHHIFGIGGDITLRHSSPECAVNVSSVSTIGIVSL